MQNYATFTGRARMKEYWYFVLFSFLITLIVGLIGLAANVPELEMAAELIFFIPGLAVGVRRMHDVGKSGWYLLIPFYNFYLTINEGVIGENQYGPDPLAVEEEG